MSNEGLEAFVERGLYFGYPPCCILSFLKRVQAIDQGENIDTSAQKRIMNNKHGFIPCPTHAEMIVTKKTTIEEIIQNRICEKHFPHGY